MVNGWTSPQMIGDEPVHSGRIAWSASGRYGGYPEPKVLFYGGRMQDASESGGLYQVPLDPAGLVVAGEAGSRLDAGADPTPGGRVGAALAIDRRGRFVYLYGGQRAGEQLRDLWRYTISAGVWELLSDGTPVGAPPPMAVVNLLVSSIDGSVLVIAGTRSTHPEAHRSAAGPSRKHGPAGRSGLAWARSRVHSPPIGTYISRRRCLT